MRVIERYLTYLIEAIIDLFRYLTIYTAVILREIEPVCIIGHHVIQINQRLAKIVNRDFGYLRYTII